jgi:hypothetical protein
MPERRDGQTTLAVDLLHDHGSLGQAQARTAILDQDQRRQPAGIGQRLDEGLRVGPLLVELAEVGAGEPRAQRPHRFAQLMVGVGLLGVSVRSPRSCSSVRSVDCDQ